MATIRIILDPHETEEEATNLLRKALSSHEEGEQHQDSFHQPAARDVCSKMIEEHEKMWQKMLREISAVIDAEVR